MNKTWTTLIPLGMIITWFLISGCDPCKDAIPSDPDLINRITINGQAISAGDTVPVDNKTNNLDDI